MMKATQIQFTVMLLASVGWSGVEGLVAPGITPIIYFGATAQSCKKPTTLRIFHDSLQSRVETAAKPKSRLVSSPSPTSLFSIDAAAVGWVTASIVGGASGTPVVARAINSWYRRIALPDWTPPDKVFAPVWTTLYGLMGYAAYRVNRVIQSNTLFTNQPIKLFLLHYVLNLVWPVVFFGMKRLRAGYIINLMLVTSLLGIVPMFYKVSPLSAILLLPYLAWLIFATKLNQAICQLNPTGSEKGYNNAMLQADIYKLQIEAGKRVGL